MLFIKKSKKTLAKQTKSQKFKKMYVYIIISNYGYVENIMKNLREYDSNAQLVCLAQGTAKKEVLNTLGFGRNDKGVIFAFVDETNVDEIRKYLNKYFMENRRVMGVGFTVPITSIVGEKIYHFLTNTI